MIVSNAKVNTGLLPYTPRGKKRLKQTPVRLTISFDFECLCEITGEEALKEWVWQNCGERIKSELQVQVVETEPSKNSRISSIPNVIVEDTAIHSYRKMELLENISRVQRMCLVDSESPRVVFGNLLQALLTLTDSEYGFIGEVKTKDNGTPYLRTHAITNLAWDQATNDFVTSHFMSDEGLNFFNNHTLFGHVMTSRETVIANDPLRDPRRSPHGLPPGHPALDHFLGIPFFAPGTDTLNGMVGIANKPGGYKQADVKFLEPFIATCGALIEAYKAIQSNKDLLNTLESKVAKRTLELEKANERAEKLLENMLPKDIAVRLKTDPSHIAEQHECVSVLFADIVGFTEYSDRTAPVEVVNLLNDLFTLFDALVEKHGLNKIKTIGDAYMVASVPHCADQSCREQCLSTCRLALDILDTVQARNEAYPECNLDVRIGINVGHVVAGVVGKKRFLYDLWGNSVNVASRMESHGVAGRVHVTLAVKDLVGEEFHFESRGPIQVKGKGKMSTWFLNKSDKEQLGCNQSKKTKDNPETWGMQEGNLVPLD